MKQLSLTEEELINIGFRKVVYPAESINPEKICYEIHTINGVFYCNQDEDGYKWYHKVVIGEAVNYTHLDITYAPALFVVLQTFRVQFNLIIV